MRGGTLIWGRETGVLGGFRPQILRRATCPTLAEGLHSTPPSPFHRRLSPAKEGLRSPACSVDAHTPSVLNEEAPHSHGLSALAKQSKPQLGSPHRLPQAMEGSEWTTNSCFVQGPEESSVSAPKARSEFSLTRIHCVAGFNAPLPPARHCFEGCGSTRGAQSGAPSHRPVPSPLWLGGVRTSCKAPWSSLSGRTETPGCEQRKVLGTPRPYFP